MLQRVERAVTRGKPFDIEIDGQMTRAYPGETIAAVLIVNRIPLTRNSDGAPVTRGYYGYVYGSRECAVACQVAIG